MSTYTKKLYEFDGEKIPAMFATPVILRMFDGDKDGMKAFLQRYKDSRIHIHTPHKDPNAFDYELAAAFKLSRNYSEVAKQFSTNATKVMRSVSHVARYEFLKS